MAWSVHLSKRKCGSRGCPLALEPSAPAPRAAHEDVGVMEQAIEERGDGSGIAEELAPILHGPVRGDEGRGALIAAHDDLEEILPRGGRELTHAEVVDDEQGHGGELDEVGLPRAAELGVGELVDERMGLAVQDAMALLDDGAAEGLGEMTLA